MPEVIKLALSVPAYGAKVQAQQIPFWMQMGFAMATSEKRFQLRSVGYIDVCGVDMARNRMTQEALDVGADWLFMLDADTWHDDPYDILQMISDADRKGAAIVGAAVPCRGSDAIVYNVYKALPTLAKPEEFLRKEEGLVEVEALGGAIMAINLNFLREHKIRPPWFKFDWIDGTIRYTGEDIYVCKHVAAAGGKVYVDGRFIGRHMQRPKEIEQPKF